MKRVLIIFLLAFGIVFYGCNKSEDATQTANNSDIPADPSGVTVPNTTNNNVTPTATLQPQNANNPSRVQLNMTGLLMPGTTTPIQLVWNTANPQNSNIFVTDNGVVKGLKVTQVSTGTQLTADVVFVVDNSGSMGEEADTVAASIVEFANFLVSQGLNVQFGVVGQYGTVNGALNLTSAQNLSNYLNRQYYTGTSRTVGYSGPDSATLANKGGYYFHNAGDENGVVGVLFADSNFSWRSGAQRVFVNFTDEPTQNYYTPYWNAAYMCAQLGGRASVHTVYTGPADTSYSLNGSWSASQERPWWMSLCSGGTFVIFPQDASGMDLKNLPVAGALANSYLVEFVNTVSGVTQHTVIITVIEQGADGKRTYTWTY